MVKAYVQMHVDEANQRINDLLMYLMALFFNKSCNMSKLRIMLDLVCFGEID